MPTTRRTSDAGRIRPTTPDPAGSEAPPRRRRAAETPLAPRSIDGTRPARLPEVGRARRSDKTVELGAVGEKTREIGLSLKTGLFTIEGRTADGAERSDRQALAIYGAAELVASGVDVAAKLTNAALREKVLANLERALGTSLEGRMINIKEKAFAGSMTILAQLARKFAGGDRELSHRAIGALLSALERVRDPEMRGFYFAQVDELAPKMKKADKKRLEALEKKVLPKAPLVEQYTANRTRPLEVRHHIHPEFWKEEVSLFTKKNGWELVKKNARDTERVYRGVLKDPLGKKLPLKVNMIVTKGELDYLEGISDPKVHMLTYSGHSSVGGNGSQAIQAAGEMVGEYPKLVFAANCRGKDNYAELTNKWPEAHVIMTEAPTYSVNGQERLRALFATLAAGESYAWMRGNVGETHWDEPAKNYFYPDERRKFRFMDADQDGRVDAGALGRDRLFDVDARIAGDKFVRGLNFANSELFYHWEVDLENGRRSNYGRRYGDSLEAAGPFFDAKKGELIRVKRVKVQGPRVKDGSRFFVSFAPSVARAMDENLVAGHVTAHAVMALAKLASKGQLTKKEALRAVLMGAQAIHYLDVYIDSQPVTFRKYFSQVGLTDRMDEKDIERIFEEHDAHANDAQVEAFRRLLEKKYKVDVEAWTPKLGRYDAVVTT